MTMVLQRPWHTSSGFCGCDQFMLQHCVGYQVRLELGTSKFLTACLQARRLEGCVSSSAHASSTILSSCLISQFRLLWALKVTTNFRFIGGTESGLFGLELLEILRRSVWMCLRTEKEWITTHGAGNLPDGRDGNFRT